MPGSHAPCGWRRRLRRGCVMTTLARYAKPRTVLDTVKEACGTAAPSPRSAPRSLTVSAPGAPCVRDRDGETAADRTEKLIVEFGARASLAHQRPELA